MSASSPPQELRRFTANSLTGELEFCDVSWPHGEARVWAVMRAGEAVGYLKQHRQASKFQGEWHAYRHFVPVLGGAAPRLLAAREQEPCALLLSALPGSMGSEVSWSPAEEYQVHARAARLLKMLHAIPVDAAGRDRLETKTRAWATSWLNRAAAHFPQATIDWARRETDTGIAAHPPICVCHKDFGPRNWLVKDDGDVALIDFERTAIDFQCIDWSRLWMREWLRRPELRDAFFEGYGAVPVEWESTMRRLLAVYAVGGVVWAIEHGDAAFAEENRHLVARLQQLSLR